MDDGGGLSLEGEEVGRRTDRQTGRPPAVPQQWSLLWNGDVAKNNISQHQQGSFHTHHSSGSL